MLQIDSSFSKEKLINEEVSILSHQIFSVWDREGEGVVFSDDILSSSGLEDVEFGIALARILGLHLTSSYLPLSLTPFLISDRK